MIDEIISDDAARTASQIKSLADRKILITGGAGFIGSWLCDILSATGSNITCIDNLSTGLTENLDHHNGRGGFRFIEEDISALTTPLPPPQDFILHLASRASPDEYQEHPIETLRANSLGTLTVLELARKWDSPLLYTSTSEVYGDAQTIPTPETYWGHVNPVGVRSCYDEGKRFGEALCMAYRREHGLDIRITRIFNTYGPRIRADGAYARALPKFITQALAGKDITVYGEGSQTRSFSYITDTAHAILQALTTPKAEGEILNVGNPHEVAILKLAGMIRNLTASRSKITFHPLPPDDPYRRQPDIRKVTRILNWKPEISLGDGLKKTIAWYSRRVTSTSSMSP